MVKVDYKNGAGVVMVAALAALVISSASFFVSFANISGKIASDQEMVSEDMVVAHISSGIENPHAILMGLKTAELFLDNGKEVFVYFDVKGVAAAVKQNNITYADFPPSQTIIANLIERGRRFRFAGIV